MILSEPSLQKLSQPFYLRIVQVRLPSVQRFSHQAIQIGGPFPKHEYRPEVGYVATTVKVPKALQDQLCRLTPREDPDFGRWDATLVFDILLPNPNTCNTMYNVAKLNNDKSKPLSIRRDHSQLLIMNCLVILGLATWGEAAPCRTFSQFVEAVHRIHDQSHGVDTPNSRRHSWIFDFLKGLGESVEEVDETLEFISYRVVSAYYCLALRKFLC